MATGQAKSLVEIFEEAASTSMLFADDEALKEEVIAA